MMQSDLYIMVDTTARFLCRCSICVPKMRSENRVERVSSLPNAQLAALLRMFVGFAVCGAVTDLTVRSLMSGGHHVDSRKHSVPASFAAFALRLLIRNFRFPEGPPCRWGHGSQHESNVYTLFGKSPPPGHGMVPGSQLASPPRLGYGP